MLIEILKSMLKNLLLAVFFVGLLAFSGQSVFAQGTDGVNIYFFWGEGCPHCAKEKPFLDQIENKYSEVTVHSFETWYDAENRDLFIKAGQALRTNVSGVPFTIIGNQDIVGYLSDATTGKKIEDAVKNCLERECLDPVGEVLGIAASDNGAAESPMPVTEKEESSAVFTSEESSEGLAPEKVAVPLLGEVDVKDFSLPLLTIVLGGLDGFNPCAMWTLLFLISLLLGMKNKKRMWVLGSSFIVASAAVYFVFMVAWLNLILFIGMVVWVRTLIGLVAIAGGGYNLKEYFTSAKAVCKVTGSEKRQKVFDKLKGITQQKSFYLALGGIIILAFAVNLVELVCSAGLPAIYTQVLALSDLAKWQYYLYILLYIFIFMLDDLIVFVIAMTTLQMTGLTTKYSNWSRLIGGVLMLIIGLLLIFKPEWLMF